jgi:acetoin utilization protein AcuB
MFVRDRMSSPAVTITPDEMLRDALQLMHRGRFRQLPVVDDDGKLVGIVSKGDLGYALPSRPGSLSVWEQNRLVSKVRVQEVMTKQVTTTRGDVPVEDVARLMTDSKIRGLPVVDDEDHVIGVITETDIFKAFVEMFAGGHSGLRLTLEIPEGKDCLLELAKAISELGGSIVSVGSFGSDAPDKRGLIVKVQGARKDQLVDTLEALGDHVADARDV